MKVLFLVTELYRPVGGLHRYTVRLLGAWKRALERRRDIPTLLVFSIKKVADPPRDLKVSKYFRKFVQAHEGIQIYEAKRGGNLCYFVEGIVPDLNAFHYLLWKKYRIRSEAITQAWPNYKDLCTFWYWMPRIAQWLVEQGVEIACIDAQDWLAFPAGFLTREQIGRPLICRFHSGEFGRSLGNPQFDMAPVLVEIASLIEADYVQGVSIEETAFEVINLMPHVERLTDELRKERGDMWYAYQTMKNVRYKEFLIYEPEAELVLIRDVIGAMPNGILLDMWKEIKVHEIRRAAESMRKWLPGKEKFVIFLGRPEYRKGLTFLIEAWQQVKERVPEAGLIIATSLTKDEYEEWQSEIKRLDIQRHVYLLNRWLENHEKAALFCASDVIALPSVYEPFGIVALEGLAADYVCQRLGLTGPVVVVGNTGGMGEIIRSGVNGLEVPIAKFSIDVDLLARVLIQALTDEELRKRLAKEGARRVQSKFFSWDFLVERVFEIYQKAEENYKVYQRFLI
jgi:glycosyltransferase involved in cell wall biosynthesis